MTYSEETRYGVAGPSPYGTHTAAYGPAVLPSPERMPDAVYGQAVPTPYGPPASSPYGPPASSVASPYAPPRASAYTQAADAGSPVRAIYAIILAGPVVLFELGSATLSAIMGSSWGEWAYHAHFYGVGVSVIKLVLTIAAGVVVVGQTRRPFGTVAFGLVSAGLLAAVTSLLYAVNQG